MFSGEYAICCRILLINLPTKGGCLQVSVTSNEGFGEIPQMNWDADKMKRYRRHLLLHEIGMEGQERIAASRVLVVGTGGLGSPIIAYLAAAGVGKIGIADGDVVELSNLQRQILFGTPDLGKKKTLVAAEKVKNLNPDVQVEAYDFFLNSENAESVIKQYDFVCEGSDNYPAKLLVNDICVRNHKPFTMGSLSRFEGQAFTHTEGTACWRCMYGAAPKAGGKGCGQTGVLGTVPGIIGAVEATEAIKFITGAGVLLTNRLFVFDALTMNSNVFEIARDQGCPVCGNKRKTIDKTEYNQICCKK